MTNEELSKAFGISVTGVVRIKEQAKQFSPKALKKAVDSLADADYQIKSGLRNADDNLWLTVFKIMTEE